MHYWRREQEFDEHSCTTHKQVTYKSARVRHSNCLPDFVVQFSLCKYLWLWGSSHEPCNTCTCIVGTLYLVITQKFIILISAFSCVWNQTVIMILTFYRITNVRKSLTRRIFLNCISLDFWVCISCVNDLTFLVWVRRRSLGLPYFHCWQTTLFILACFTLCIWMTGQNAQLFWGVKFVLSCLWGVKSFILYSLLTFNAVHEYHYWHASLCAFEWQATTLQLSWGVDFALSGLCRISF